MRDLQCPRSNKAACGNDSGLSEPLGASIGEPKSTYDGEGHWSDCPLASSSVFHGSQTCNCKSRHQNYLASMSCGGGSWKGFRGVDRGEFGMFGSPHFIQRMRSSTLFLASSPASDCGSGLAFKLPTVQPKFQHDNTKTNCFKY